VARSEFILEPLQVLALPSSHEPAQEHADAQHNPDAQKPSRRDEGSSPSPPFPGGHLQITKASDLGPDTRQQHDLDTPDGWKRVPLHVGRAAGGR